MNKKEKKQSLSVHTIVVFATVVLLAIIGISTFFVIRNNVIKEAQAVSINEYPEGLPEDVYENIGLQLKNILKEKFDASEEEKIEAEIRSDSIERLKDSNIYTMKFLVDIDEYKQTYLVSASWSDTVEVSDGIVISCTNRSQSKYPDSMCKSMYNTTVDVERIENNPLYEKLPIVVDYFNFEERRAVHYEIRGSFDDEDQLVLTVVDYSGNNYVPAIVKLIELGYKTDDYHIEYVDQSGGY